MTRIVDRFRRTPRTGIRGDEGFGLVEIMVSITLLALLSIMFLPLLIQGLKISAWNTTLATANQLVNQKLAAAQDLSPNCTQIIEAFDTPGESVVVVEDPRGVQIQVTTTTSPDDPDDCPAAITDDLFVVVSVDAERLDEPGRTLVSAESFVFVEPTP